MHQIRDEIRWARRRPEGGALPEKQVHQGPSPLKETMQWEFMQRYETALGQLEKEQRKAVVLRLEMGYTFPEVAKMIGSPSANATRMLVKRAVARLAEKMETTR